jgi:putative hydrolase of HD superfamily
MLSAALPFLLTADRLKRVTRQNTLHDGSRPENAAEHAWHAALTALVLAEYAPPGTNTAHVVDLLLAHDLAEIEAGDRFILDAPGTEDRREARAARPLFGSPPTPLNAELHALWTEFDAGITPEAAFARQLDALAPALLSWGDGGAGRALWGPPSDAYRAVKRRALTHPALYAAFHAWMVRAGAPADLTVSTPTERLSRQLAFLTECGRLKGVRRTTYLHDGSRPENSAEHSWHLALMALLGGLPPGTDRAHVIRLLLVHDLVEIHAGDTHFDATPEALARQADQEAQAARTLFGRLPDDQAASLRGLWEEFEAQRTPEARYARALDALQPMLLTWGPGGRGCTDRHPELTAERLLALKRPRLEAYPELWALAQQIVSDAVGAGLLPAAPVTAGMKLRLSP